MYNNVAKCLELDRCTWRASKKNGFLFLSLFFSSRAHQTVGAEDNGTLNVLIGLCCTMAERNFEIGNKLKMNGGKWQKKKKLSVVTNKILAQYTFNISVLVGTEHDHKAINSR